MIDRSSRNILAEKLQQYSSGWITNDDLYDTLPPTTDRGVIAVWQMSWNLYSDLSKHKATDKYKITGETRNLVKRCICFLHSDNEYKWPKYNFILDNIYFQPLNILTLGLIGILKKKKFNKFKSYGNFQYWPFINENEFKELCDNPRLLTDEVGSASKVEPI